MFCGANDDSNGYQCNQQDLGPASDSKMAAAVNMHVKISQVLQAK